MGENEIIYSGEAFILIQNVSRLVKKRLTERSKELAMVDGRKKVTEDDVHLAARLLLKVEATDES